MAENEWNDPRTMILSLLGRISSGEAEKGDCTFLGANKDFEKWGWGRK